MIVHRTQVHDCLQRVRYRYGVTPAVDETLLDLFSDKERWRISTFDARHLLKLARVTFQIEATSGHVLVAGALGLDYVSVTYQKGPHLESAVQAQEALLNTIS